MRGVYVIYGAPFCFTVALSASAFVLSSSLA